jgi:hypothetical protein
MTLYVTRLSNDDLARLCALEQLKWGVMYESVDLALIGLWNDLGREGIEKDELHNLISQQQNEIEDIGSQAAAQAREIADHENGVGWQLYENDDFQTETRNSDPNWRLLSKSRVESKG